MIASFRKNEKGFTLIEMMVVVIIVGVLAAIAVPTYTGYVKRATTAEATSMCGAIWGGIKIYMLDHKTVPGATDPTKILDSFNVDIRDAVYYTYAVAVANDTDVTITASGVASGRASGVVVVFDPYAETAEGRFLTTGL